MVPLGYSRLARRLVLGAVVALMAMLGGGSAFAAVAPWSIVSSTPASPTGYFSGVVSGDGSTFYASNQSPSEVDVIDLATNATTSSISMSEGTASYSTLSGDGRLLFVCEDDTNGGAVKMVDTRTNTVVRTFLFNRGAGYDNNLQCWDIVSNADGSLVYVSDGVCANGVPCFVTKINTATSQQTPLPDPSSQFFPHGLALSPSGDKLYALVDKRPLNDSQTFVFVVDTATFTIGRQIPISGSEHAKALEISPDGRTLYTYDPADTNGSFPTGDSFLSTDIATGITTALPVDGPDISVSAGQSVAVNPTGTFALVSRFYPRDVVVINLVSNAVEKTIPLAPPEQYCGPGPANVVINAAGTRGYVTQNPFLGCPSPPGDPAAGLVTLALPTPPNAPADVAATPGDGTLAVSYSAPDDNGSPITDYEYSLDGGTTWVSAKTTATRFTISGLKPGTAYSVKVRAVNTIGAGQPSAAVAATTSAAGGQPAAPTVTVSVPAANVTRGATLTTVVNPSAAGTVKVTATLRGRTVCTATKKATKAGRMPVTCTLSARAKAAIRLRPVTLAVTARFTDAQGQSATAKRTVKVPRYKVRTPVTG